MFFQDDRYSISVMGAVTIFTKFYVNSLFITIAMTIWSILYNDVISKCSRKFHFLDWSIENVRHDIYYNYANVHAFTTFWTIVL